MKRLEQIVAGAHSVALSGHVRPDGDCVGSCLAVYNYIRENFPECERVSIYGRGSDIIKKTDEEMKELYDAGLTMVYVGAESGSDKVLQAVCKGETRQQIIDGVKKVEACGMKSSVTFISGLAGREGWEDHAIQTGTMISEMEPSYVGLLTLIVEPNVPMAKEIEDGTFTPLTPEEVMAETLLMLEHTDVSKTCVLRSNHASNYVSLKGDLPADRERMIEQLKVAQKHSEMWKDERFRML